MAPFRSSVDVFRVLKRLLSLAKACAPIPRVILHLILYDPPAFFNQSFSDVFTREALCSALQGERDETGIVSASRSWW